MIQLGRDRGGIYLGFLPGQGERPAPSAHRVMAGAENNEFKILGPLLRDEAENNEFKILGPLLRDEAESIGLA